MLRCCFVSYFRMDVQSGVVTFLVVFTCISSSCFFGYCKVLLQKLENCDQSETYNAKINFTFKLIQDKQYVSGAFDLNAPIDNNLKHNVSIESLVGKQYVYLFSINERKSCNALNKYFGEFWYDIERQAQIIPGLCPVEKGRYQIHNCLMDWKKMATLQNFPFGHLRVTFMVYDSKNSVYTCLVLEGTNQV